MKNPLSSGERHLPMAAYIGAASVTDCVVHQYVYRSKQCSLHTPKLRPDLTHAHEIADVQWRRQPF